MLGSSPEAEVGNPIYTPLVRLADGVRRKRISPVELIDAHIARIEAVNPQLNAFAHFDFDAARKQAKTAEQTICSRSQGKAVGPLHGVPVTVKSSIDVAGFPCECGSRLRKGYIAQQDAPLVARLRAAGAIIIGSTNVPEFLMAYETDNLLCGRANNPWDLTRTPGGSSGGEAAAIASGCSAGGVGSDGGGSIRVPAHFSGICGLKPTPGRIPATGHFPASAGPFATLGVVGPMARSIQDVQLLFEIMAGPDAGDPCAAPAPLRRWKGHDHSAFRVAYFEEDQATPVTSETAAAVRQAAKALHHCGVQVEAWLPDDLQRVWQLWWNLFGRAGQMAFSPIVDGHDADLSPLFREFRGFVAAAPRLEAEELLNTLLERDALRAKFLRAMENFAVVLCPVCSVPAFKHGERLWVIEGHELEYLKAMSYCQWFNLLGNPAAVVPVSRSPEGLPIGVQIVGRPWEEELVLAIALKIEEASGGFRCPRPSA